MKAATEGPQVATANRLRDGAVVFLADDGSWTVDLQAARVATAPAEALALNQIAEEAVRRAHVVGPYLIAVSDRSGRWVPLSYRERIRAEGPSLDLERFTPPQSAARPVE